MSRRFVTGVLASFRASLAWSPHKDPVLALSTLLAPDLLLLSCECVPQNHCCSCPRPPEPLLASVRRLKKGWCRHHGPTNQCRGFKHRLQAAHEPERETFDAVPVELLLHLHLPVYCSHQVASLRVPISSVL